MLNANVGRALLLLTLIGAASGCSQNQGVSGTVTQGGSPISRAEITFHSTEGERRTELFGCVSDEKGQFHTKLPRSVKAGTFKVTVKKFVPIEGVSETADLDMEQLKRVGKAKNSLPAKYESVKSTPLTAEVKPGQKDLKLEVN